MGFRSFRFIACFFVLMLSTAAFAAGPHERTQVGHSITIRADEEVSEATCFGCSIHVRGHVAGDITSFGGSIVIEENGEVGGDATSFGGDVRLDKGVKVSGDVVVFGGRLRRDPAASVGGDVTSMGGGPAWLFLIFGLPLLVLGAIIALIVWLVRRLLRPAIPAAA
ncbi:MAG TPA: polymer-forming cytoskeletal protein [Candidatus Dormibacteraeota bacterium]|nr:polymer-forming cytoskeletal protein [Candidatus Dormibacteraeota bacterium]